MGELNLADVAEYVETNIGGFHAARLESLDGLSLKRVLRKKNPYLFKAKNILTAEELVRTVMDAHLSSQEETMFGDFLEGLAIFVCSRVYDGGKSAAPGIDLEFEKDGIHYIVAIKSGPNWGNASQIEKMKEDFRRARRTLQTSRSGINVMAVNGCCYGRDSQPQKNEYQKLCGQRFWAFVSEHPELYVEIIEPLGHRAKETNEEFRASYAQLVNKFTHEFGEQFFDDGKIDWGKLVRFNSAAEA